MENFKPGEQNEDEKIIDTIDGLISELEQKSEITHDDYKQLERRLNKIQRGINVDDVNELKKFEPRMNAIFERIIKN